ncbi:hypothetical protein [Fulvimarina sp. MAC8]|uniref:hypothetical protein n=1 Tax=Fulvimarina sp. MAC8 TaxID=3162874 RepID=UPI0032F02685
MFELEEPNVELGSVAVVESRPPAAPLFSSELLLLSDVNEPEDVPVSKEPLVEPEPEPEFWSVVWALTGSAASDPASASAKMDELETRRMALTHRSIAVMVHLRSSMRNSSKVNHFQLLHPLFGGRETDCERGTKSFIDG